MAMEDEERMAFVIELGTFYYKGMPFSLKNVAATYQRILLHAQLNKRANSITGFFATSSSFELSVL